MRIGLALGAGGANGLAHILMLQVFDELGLRPARIAGSSVGAIIGALYASGRSGDDIDAIAEELALKESDSWKELLLERKLFRYLELLDPELGRGGFVSGQALLAFLYGTDTKIDFADLRIPLRVVATDLWRREPVVLESGPVLPAVRASMALPGVFTPVTLGGRVLVDGGAVNPLPYDLLDDCDVTVAINVTGKRSPKDDFTFLDSVFNTFQIMQSTIINEKLARAAPTVYIETDIVDVRALEVQKRDQVYAGARPAKEELKRRLKALVRDAGAG
ncbi:patatin-like phospholipase family protein [Arhodomonas sp. SL1]|uniref:patatin-like phospholipase family protein n=1 Tax=Arhodomonas sp. SL1 TaxID=3425691 RepID=UPI003F881154